MQQSKTITQNFSLLQNKLNQLESTLLKLSPPLVNNGSFKRDLRNECICLKWKTRTIVRFKTNKNLTEKLLKGTKVLKQINKIAIIVDKTDLVLDFEKKSITLESESIPKFKSSEFDNFEDFIDHVRTTVALYFEQLDAA